MEAEPRATPTIDLAITDRAMEPTTRALPATPAYWAAMLAASALGTNLGDLWANTLFHNRSASLGTLLAVCGAGIWYDRRISARSEGGYWLAIVMMRAAATNLADIFTHDLALGYLRVSILLWGLTLLAARFTHPDFGRGGSPRVDAGYWGAMFVAGLFGTVAGDLIDHTIGLSIAAVLLSVGLTVLIAARGVFAPASALLYWSIVMAERCAGTAVGDALASRRVVDLGVPLASVCTATWFAFSLAVRTRYRTGHQG